MDTEGTVVTGAGIGEPASALLRDPARMAVALDGLAGLAARLLGAPSGQITLLDDVALIAAGAGLPEGAVGSEGPLSESLCTVTAAGAAPLVVPDALADDRVRTLPPVTSRRVGAYLGVPLIDRGGRAIGALCVFGPEPRTWSGTDVATLAQLAGSAVTELELSALACEYENDRLRWELATDAAGIGTFDWDLRSGRLVWDERLRDLFGYAEDGFEETIESFNRRLHPDDLPRVTEALQASIEACGDFAAEYRVIRPDGETRWVLARGRALPDRDGAPARVVGAAYDTTEHRAGELRVSRILEVMPAGFWSLDREERFTAVNAEAERILGQTRDELIGRPLWDAFPAALGTALEDNVRRTLRSRQPVSFEAHFPAPVDRWLELRIWPTPDGLSVWFLEITERRQVREQAERAAERLAIIARVSAELAGTLDVEAATARIPRLVVPAIADWCILTVIGPDGHPRDVGSWHVDPAKRPLVERYRQVRLDAMPLTAPVSQALYTGEATTFPGAAVLDQLPPGPARALLAVLDPETEVALPLRARGRTLGLLTLLYGEGHSPTQEDVATAQDVADRAGLALDNARLYGEQQQLAEGLQRSLLTEPPEPDHAQIAVRYLPAAEAARVGGDWYDAFLQPGGGTVLVIGDVVGHDTEAAAAMGQLRGLLRGIATYSDACPVELLRGLDASLATLQMNVLATATVARLEQTDEERERGLTRMRWANAGHLPPLVINPDGTVAELAAWSGDLLLGVDPEARRSESVVTLDRGATVLLYTDGLVERRDADLDQGMVRLRDVLIELADLPLEELLDQVLDRLVHGHPEDDVALVAIRLHRQDQPRPPEAGPTRVPPTVDPEPRGNLGG